MPQYFTGLSPEQYTAPLSAYVEGRKARQDIRLGENRVKLSDLTTKWMEEDRPYEVEKLKRDKTLGDQQVTLGGLGLKQAGREEEIGASTFEKQKEYAINLLESRLSKLNTDQKAETIAMYGDAAGMLQKALPYMEKLEQYNNFVDKINGFIGDTGLPTFQNFSGTPEEFPTFRDSQNKLISEVGAQFQKYVKQTDYMTGALKTREANKTAEMKKRGGQGSAPKAEDTVKQPTVSERASALRLAKDELTLDPQVLPTKEDIERRALEILQDRYPNWNPKGVLVGGKTEEQQLADEDWRTWKKPRGM